MNTKRIKELQKSIIKARRDYYNKESKISDKLFDAWIEELKLVDPTNVAITSIGYQVTPSVWTKAKHAIGMGSLDKVNTPEELKKWSQVLPHEKLFCTEKLDGISINCAYESGKLIQCITRGDGFIGEDIFVNVKRMSGAQENLKSDFTGSIRGEIIMLKSTYKNHFSDKSNPRNAASGVSKRLDGVDVDKLNVIFYQVLGDVDFKTEIEQFEWLKSQGFITPNYWLFKNSDDVSKHWRDYQDVSREKLDYEIDGLVVRINDLEKQLSLGDKDMRGLGCVAFKFDNQCLESTILDIKWSCGNSGRLTPVAIVNKVFLSGAWVEKANIYNISYINQLKLDIGAKVLITRANDVIPRIEELVEGTGKIHTPPDKCPECNSNAVINGENLQCSNVEFCPAQIGGRVHNWISELNILEWGDALIEKLVESGKLKTVADLYKLKLDDLANLDRMAETSAKNCYKTLWDKTELTLDVLIGALSITMIGSSSIRTIMAAGIDSLEKLNKSTAEQLSNINGIGPVKAKCLVDGLKHYKSVIDDLLKSGVKIKEKIIGPLTGKSICITGSTTIKRATLEEMASSAGAEVKSSVGKSCTYLIIADPNSTSSKAVAARKLGVKLISESELLKILN